MTQTDYDSFLAFKTAQRYRQWGLPDTQTYRDRIAYELDVIRQTHYAAYFLIVSDLCDFMRSAGIMFNVRGSGCGSVVVWSLGITNRFLDPIRLRLPFERFLNPSRVSNPDLDIDIDDTRRHEVVEYTIRKYGDDRVAHIITFGTLGPKAAINDVMRAMQGSVGSDYQQRAKQITGAIPATAKTFAEAMAGNEFLAEQEQLYGEVFNVARRVEGRTRHASIHAAGVIIAPEPLHHFMPGWFKGATEGRTDHACEPTTQWDMYDVEARGLLKMDYLGLRTLRVVDQAVRVINGIRLAQGNPEPFILDEIPYDDTRTWQMLANGDLAGVFQIEKRFVREFAKRMGLMRRDFWALAVLISIIRPGMMHAGTTEVYLRRASGQEEALPPHPLLSETLRENFGLWVFQEDCMLTCQDMASMSMSEADEVRRGIAKKKPKLLAEMKPKFVAGAVSRGATEAEAEQIWSQMETFGSYGFNRAHAAAYAMVSYWTAYLKANHPLVYMTMLINSESGVGNVEDGYNFKVSAYIEEARTMGLTVLPPCVKRSAAFCKLYPATNEIRFGLEMIKKVAAKAAEWVLAEAYQANSFKEFILAAYSREQRQAGESGGSEWRSVNRINKTSLEGLILAGALDVYGMSRSRMLAMLPELQRLAEKYHQQTCRILNGSTRLRLTPEKLREAIDEYDIEEDDLPESMSLEEQLAAEREVTGCYLSQSPFAPFVAQQSFCTTSAGELTDGEWPQGNAILMGMVTQIREIIVRKGKSKGREMAFVEFTGPDGGLEATCFADDWEKIRSADPLERHAVYLIKVRADRDGQRAILCEARRLSDRGFGAGSTLPVADCEV